MQMAAPYRLGVERQGSYLYVTLPKDQSVKLSGRVLRPAQGPSKTRQFTLSPSITVFCSWVGTGTVNNIRIRLYAPKRPLPAEVDDLVHMEHEVTRLFGQDNALAKIISASRARTEGNKNLWLSRARLMDVVHQLEAAAKGQDPRS